MNHWVPVKNCVYAAAMMVVHGIIDGTMKLWVLSIILKSLEISVQKFMFASCLKAPAYHPVNLACQYILSPNSTLTFLPL